MTHKLRKRVKILFIFSLLGAEGFSSVLVIKTLDPDWIRIGIEPTMLDRIRNLVFGINESGSETLNIMGKRSRCVQYCGVRDVPMMQTSGVRWSSDTGSRATRSTHSYSNRKTRFRNASDTGISNTGSGP
jgi:hypothetical protein